MGMLIPVIVACITVGIFVATLRLGQAPAPATRTR